MAIMTEDRWSMQIDPKEGDLGRDERWRPSLFGCSDVCQLPQYLVATVRRFCESGLEDWSPKKVFVRNNRDGEIFEFDMCVRPQMIIEVARMTRSSDPGFEFSDDIMGMRSWGGHRMSGGVGKTRERAAIDAIQATRVWMQASAEGLAAIGTDEAMKHAMEIRAAAGICGQWIVEIERTLAG